MILSPPRMSQTLGPAPWTKVYDISHTIGYCIICFATGMWVQSAIDKSQSLPWLHQQAAVATKLETKVVPALKAEAGCEHWRADTATNLAVQNTIVDPSAIPKDNCPHAAVPQKH